MKDECNAFGWKEDEIIVRREDLKSCETIEEYLLPTPTHAGIILKKYDYEFINFAPLTLILSILFTLSVMYTSMGEIGTIRFLGGFFLPLLVQLIVIMIMIRRIVVPIIFPVISMVPGFLLTYYPYPNVYSPNKFAKALMISSIVGLLIAVVIMINNTFSILSSESISFNVQPLLTYFISGTLRPMGLGAYSYIIATFVSLLPYTASVGYYVLRRKNCVLPLLIASIFFIIDKNLASMLVEYILMSIIICMFMPAPSVLNIEEEGSLVVTILYALLASLVVPVIR